MAAGRYDSIKVEIEFNPALGVFTDVTQYVDMINGVRVQFGRASEFEEISSGTLNLALWNDSGHFSPDNPLSMYFPNVVEGRRIRVIVTKGATTSTRFFGRVSSWDPIFGSGDPSQATVGVTAVDCFALLARRVFKCDFTERWLATARTDAVDMWPMDDASSDGGLLTNPTSFNNAGSTVQPYTGTVVYPKNGEGSITMEEPDGIVLDGSVATTAANGLGPVMVFRGRNTEVKAIVLSFRTAEVYDGNEKWIASGHNSEGTTLWSIRVRDDAGASSIFLVDAAETTFYYLYSQFAPAGASQGDDQWFTFQISSDATDTEAYLVRSFNQSTRTFWGSIALSSIDIRNTKFVVLGGKMNPLSRSGTQRLCTTAKYGTLIMSNNKFTSGYMHLGYVGVNQVEPAQTRLADLTTYANFQSSSIFGGVQNPNVILKRLTGRTADECVNELARTMGGAIYPRYIGANDKWLTCRTSDGIRNITVDMTVDAEADLDASNGIPLARETASRPTRVTATWPAGQTTLIGDESQYRLDETVDTTAATEALALSVGSATLNRSTSTRIKSLRLDLVTATNDLYTAAMAMRPGSRLRLTSLPTTLLGLTYVDSYVQGWTETWTVDGAVFEFDLSPADAPVEGVFDDDEYGRFSADDQIQLAYPLTSVATNPVVQPINYNQAVFTTDTGAYPMDVDLLGERVTVSGQATFTRTNRCTNPSFETNTTGWGSSAGYTAATYATSTTFKLFGSQSLLVTWGNVSAAASIAAFTFTGLTVGNRYDFSIYAYVPGAFAGGVLNSPDVRVVEANGAGTSVTYAQQTTAGVRDGWVRLSMSLLASATSHTFGVVNDAAATTGQRVYLDGCLMENTSRGSGLYFDGSVNAGTWTGTAHASTSSRTAQELTITARGVAPTLARAHQPGENVDVWHAAAFAF